VTPGARRVLTVTPGPPRLLGVVAAFALAWPQAARADGPADTRTAAQVLFDRARALVEENHFAEACPQFAESERLDPGIGSLLWLADCYETTGQTANAWITFEQAQAMAAFRHDPRESVARSRAVGLEARLSHLVIVVPPEVADVPGFQVHCDGLRIESPRWSHAIPIDPGTHTITVDADDRQAWWTTVQLAAGPNTTSVTVPELAPPSATARNGGGRIETSSPARAPGTSQRVVGASLAVAGMASVLVGAAFSLDAKAKYDDSASLCPQSGMCTAGGTQDRSAAGSMATVATVAIGLGAAAMIGGSLLYFTAPRTAPVTVAMLPDARGGSLRVRWAW
jgi:hypothetical protein